MYSHAAASRRRWPRSLGKSHLQLFTSKAVSKRWGSSLGKCEHTAVGAQGRTLLLGRAWVSPTAPREGPGCWLAQAALEGVTVVLAGTFGLAQLWSCQSRPQLWQEWKGDEHPWEEGRGSSSGIFRAYQEGQRAGASKPCSFFRVRPSYRSLICM